MKPPNFTLDALNSENGANHGVVVVTAHGTLKQIVSKAKRIWCTIQQMEVKVKQDEGRFWESGYVVNKTCGLKESLALLYSPHPNPAHPICILSLSTFAFHSTPNAVGCLELLCLWAFCMFLISLSSSPHAETHRAYSPSPLRDLLILIN